MSRMVHHHQLLAGSLPGHVRSFAMRSQKVNSLLAAAKSRSLFINNHRPLYVAATIIGANEAPHRLKIPVNSPSPTSGAPAVQRLIVDEGGADQRLDNFLIKVLKGAPKTLVYRIIRSGEVRVNKGRAAADTRLALGDEVRVPPLRLPPPVDPADPLVPAREFAV